MLVLLFAPGARARLVYLGHAQLIWRPQLTNPIIMLPNVLINHSCEVGITAKLQQERPIADVAQTPLYQFIYLLRRYRRALTVWSSRQDAQLQPLLFGLKMILAK